MPRATADASAIYDLNRVIARRKARRVSRRYGPRDSTLRIGADQALAMQIAAWRTDEEGQHLKTCVGNQSNGVWLLTARLLTAERSCILLRRNAFRFHVYSVVACRLGFSVPTVIQAWR